jgi:PAS domain S-box-containing protein
MERLHPQDRLATLARWPELLRGGRLDCEYRLRSRTGEYRWLRDELRMSAGDTGTCSDCIGAWSDITEAKHAELALRQAEEQYRSVVEESLQGIVVQQDGRIEYVNRACIRMFGYLDADELIGRPWERLVVPEEVPAMGARLAACARGDTVPLLPRWQGMRKNGSRLWLESVVSRISWHGRAAILTFIMDITERRRLEEQYNQAQKMEAIGQLAGGVAHDFNNLLTVINGYGEILLATLAPGDPNRNFVDEMKRAGERAASLTRQLLVFSRKEVLAPRVLDVNAVVHDVEMLMQRMIGEDVDLATSLHATRPVLADPGRIDQVLMNLAVNARDAMPQGGKLTIESRDIDLDETFARLHPDIVPGKYVLLAVSDTGSGMTSDVQEHLFEPFFTTKPPGKGTGLGLATVYGIIKHTGGHIGVYSEPGHGATFKIYLPATLPEPDRWAAASDARPEAHGNETVLLVEDEEAVRSLVHHVLKEIGYRVLQAPSGGAALRICDEHSDPIHLLITDVVMPAMGGRQLAEAACVRHPEMRVLFLSGYTDDAIVRHGVLHENVCFLQKPFAASVLREKVREVLDDPVR